MSHRLATFTRHSDSYYKVLLLALSCAVIDRLPHREIASRLNSLGLTSATGRQFTAKTVKNTLYSLRKPLKLPSLAYRVMMKLIVDGELSKEQCMPLLSPAGAQA